MISKLIDNYKELVKGLLLTTLFLCSTVYYQVISNKYEEKYPTPYHMYHTWGSKYYHLDLTNKIQENIGAYAALGNQIRALEEGDILIIHLHNYGGSVTAEQLLVNAI